MLSVVCRSFLGNVVTAVPGTDVNVTAVITVTDVTLTSVPGVDVTVITVVFTVTDVTVITALSGVDVITAVLDDTNVIYYVPGIHGDNVTSINVMPDVEVLQFCHYRVQLLLILLRFILLLLLLFRYSCYCTGPFEVVMFSG